MIKHTTITTISISLLLAGCASDYEREIITKQAKLDAHTTAKETHIEYANCYSPMFINGRDNCFRQIEDTHHGRKGMGVSVTYADAYDAESTDLGFIAVANDLGEKCDGLAKGITVEEGWRRFKSRGYVFHLNCTNGNAVSLGYDERVKAWHLVEQGESDGTN